MLINFPSFKIDLLIGFEKEVGQVVGEERQTPVKRDEKPSGTRNGKDGAECVRQIPGIFSC